MMALIDGDIVLHRVGYTTDNEEPWVADARCNEMLDGILEATGASEYQIFLSDSKENNYRYKIFPEYKANRTAPRPKHYEHIKEFLIKEWGAKIAHGMEADDALGIYQDKFYDVSDAAAGREWETVICSIDKDLLQIPGNHFNFVKGEWQNVGEWQGLKWFYKQLLIGDVSDNVKGCTGIGPVKAAKALDCVSPEEGEEVLLKTVIELYQAKEIGQTLEEILNHILVAGKVLKIRQEQEEPEWHFPKSFQMAGVELSSIPSQVAENVPSTELSIVEAQLSDGFPQHGTQTEEKLFLTPQT